MAALITSLKVMPLKVSFNFPNFNFLAIGATSYSERHPLSYAELILNGEPELYLKAVTEYESLDKS